MIRIKVYNTDHVLPIYLVNSKNEFTLLKRNDNKHRVVESKNNDCYEGALVTIKVNKYERNKEARDRCLAYYGYKCQACRINLEEVYGEIAKAFIHVHHIIPLSQIQEEYKVNPEKDLIPVCPNCHAIIHKNKDKPLTIEELREIIRLNKSSR